MPEIETARLLLRPYTPQDLDELAPILSNPAVMRYSPRGPIPKDQVKEVTQEILKFFITHWQQHGFGVWAVVEKATAKLIGHCGLNFLPNSPEVEVLYRLDEAYWNQGIATEAAKVSLRYGFEEVKLDHIVAITAPVHIASRRVMEKCGLKYQKNAQFYNLDVVYYTLARSEWRSDDSLYILQL
ncbi:GNAT family N-acetyltransferase [uncultured Nostoc sp.]|uniref:GNAT family N-acetyltransferase n=1 Tax=uncultured Nostoc sp. TaxID=340711 RepID=UPI0035CBFB6F